jgi:sphingomyelin phosphodiesterase acid-like 3
VYGRRTCRARIGLIFVAICCLFFPFDSISAQTASADPAIPVLPEARSEASAPKTVSALFVSDLHFDPFWDPGKVSRLVTAPVGDWNAILSTPPSPDQQQRFVSLQETCHARGVDTSYTLLMSSFRAIEAHAHETKFIAASGDLIAHAFSCKYRALFPQSITDDYKKFVEKTMSFVLMGLRGTSSAVPVYVALGNNDSDCGDYRLDPRSDFLMDMATLVTESFPRAEQKSAQLTFAAGGYYSVLLPVPLRHTRLIVLDDVFMSPKYSTCSGKADATEADLELVWLRQQLTDARRNNEGVWIMGHIPPGIDPYSTAIKMKNVCGGAAPDMFLSSEDLPNLLIEFGDIVKLVVFAHTHTDEMRLLKPEGDVASASRTTVVEKLVPSISPINGNNPSFTVASIDQVSGALADYQVIAASNQSGADASWGEEYDFAQTYQQRSFSPSALEKLLTGFKADPTAQTEPSESYLRNFFVRDRSLELKVFWPQYVCAMSGYSPASYESCVCSLGK